MERVVEVDSEARKPRSVPGLLLIHVLPGRKIPRKIQFSVHGFVASELILNSS
jgi:hypothetical protein